MSIYDTPEKSCPYCGEQCEADWVDVGVGMVQCGPYHCWGCGASEMGPEARCAGFKSTVSTEPIGRKKVTDDSDELRTGWYKSKVSPHANTAQGVPMDHKTAKRLYEMGLLDEKGGRPFPAETAHLYEDES